MTKLSCLFPLYCHDRAVAHIFLSLCQQRSESGIKTRMVVPNCDRSCRPPNLVEAVPPLLKWLYYRRSDAPKAMAEKRFIQDVKDFDALYLWPDVSLATFRKVKKYDKTIFMERINCYTGKAKDILDDAYSRLGVQPLQRITDEMIQREDEEISLADFIFCPSPEVRKSYLESGVPDRKLISTSYGWSPKRFPNISPNKLVSETVTVLFVGSICVRKGAHLLLRAWEKSGIKGRLMLCGQMEPIVAEICKDILDRSDVIYQKYTPDIAFAYGEADIFAFPSLEEGSPLVTYEAMAHSLPILTSPMGGGGIVRDGTDGIVVSPEDEEALVASLQKLAGCAQLRARMGAAARQQAEEFTWEKVARRRAGLVLERLNARSNKALKAS